MTDLTVLSVVSEIYPLIKTGGLADVAGALPGALRSHGVTVTSLVPGYPAVLAGLERADEVWAIADLFGGPGRVVAGEAGGLAILAVDAPHLFGRDGNPYVGADGRDWPDNAFRFGALAWVAAEIGLGALPDYAPDIVHGHDWQAGLAMAYLAYDRRPRPATVQTVHNLAFQGQFPAALLSALRLPPQAYAPDGVECYGAIGFLKSGLQFADRITTVSPTYAREIQTPAEGCGLDGLLRARAGVLSGILNGIDVEVWDPATDPWIPTHFDQSHPQARQRNKTALQERFGLARDADRPLFGVISRLAWQKGLDLLAEAAPTMVEAGAQLVVLGAGDFELEQRFATLAAAHSARVGSIIGYHEDVAHLIQAGSDAILVPSRFEPCGLTQLCAMRYGALPVVAKVGGLADTVVDPSQGGADAANGLSFNPVTRPALEAALSRAAGLWRDQAQWRRLQRNGMNTDVSWAGPAGQYAALYRDLLGTKK